MRARVASNSGCREHNEITRALEFLEATANATSAPLCLAVPSFFSGNIFYCYLRVSLAPAATFSPPSPTLSFSPLSILSPLAQSLSRSHPLIRPGHRAYKHLLARNSPPCHTTQHNSTLLTLLETLLYVSVTVGIFSLFFHLCLSFSRCHYAYSFAHISGIWTMMPSARKREKKCEIERDRESDREMERERGK